MTTLSLPGFGSICALAFADERTLVAGHSEAILTFDVAKMRKGRALDASHHGHGVRALVVRDGGVYALASGYWGVVRWDLATGRYQGKIVGEDEGAGLAMSADGSTLWVARGRKLESYDVRTGAALFDPKRRRPTASISALGRGELAGVAAASDGTLLFWGDRGWGLASGGRVTSRRDEGATGGGFLADGRGFVLRGKQVVVIDAGTGADVATVAATEELWMACTNGHRIFGVTRSGVVILDWDGKVLRRADDLACRDISGIACTPSGARFAVGVMEEERTVLRVHDAGPNELAVTRTPGTKPLAGDAQEAAPPRRPRERKLSKNPPKWGVPEEQWTAEDHLDFREYVANEHLVGGMPIAELERNHDIPISRVRKWIKLYEAGGRSALRGSLGALKSYR